MRALLASLQKFPAFLSFRDALAFLSRLVPPSSGYDGTGLGNSVPFFPLAGALLGALAGFPAFLAFLAASPQTASWLTAFAYAIILAWLTRGLHWDALADLADACGSHAPDDRFWDIIKDSRIGAFGVTSLVFGISAQIIGAQACIGAGNPLALVLAPAFGRAMVIPLGRMTTPHPRSSLAALVQPGTRSTSALAAFGVTILAAFLILGFASFVLSLVLVVCALVFLVRVAARHDGVNGDFHGTAIIAGELAILVAAGI